MPKLLTTPFASEATSEYRTDVQNSTGAEPNSATYEQGFPPVTMEKIAMGGKPPKGSDLNGVLYDITDNLVSLTKGTRYGFNEAYATAIGGYPLGAVLRLENGVEVESEVNSNSINPNVDMTGWKLAVSDNGIVTWSGRTQREKNKEVISILDFPKTGEYWTETIQAADTYCYTYNKTLYFPNGVYKCDDGIIKRAKWMGEQICQIGVFPLYDDKVNMVGDKTNLKGTVLLFTGSSTKTYTTQRTDQFSSMRYAVLNIGREAGATSGMMGRGCENLSIISDFDFKDENGVITTPLNDNRADYDVGLLLVNSEQSKPESVCVGGYWKKSGIVHFGQDPDDTHFYEVKTMGNIGLAIIGDGTGTNSGFNAFGCVINSNDHHSRYTGTGEDWGECAVYIDIPSSTGESSRNCINFFGGSISTKTNTTVKYDRCGDVGWFGTKFENADQSGSSQAGGVKRQIGTQYTGDISFTNCRFTSDQIRIGGALLETATESTVKVIGGSLSNGFEYWRGTTGYRVQGTKGQTNIQMTSNPLTSTSGVVLRKVSTENTLRVLCNNKESVRFGESGIALSLVEQGPTQTVTGGIITVSRNWHRLSGGTTILTTINGGALGQKLLLNSATTADQITLQDNGGNLRLNENFITTNPQNYIELIFDGTNWCELTRSINS